MKAGLGAVGAVVLAAVCCGGLPILLALSAAAGTAGVIGGGVALAIVAGIGIGVMLLRGARRRSAAARSPVQNPIRGQDREGLSP